VLLVAVSLPPSSLRDQPVAISREIWTDGSAAQSALTANDMLSELAQHMPDDSQLTLKQNRSDIQVNGRCDALREFRVRSSQFVPR
jgi:hypothetical protein